MANDGLMSIAANPELSLVEKFLLGGLVGAQEQQAKTYAAEEKYINERSDAIADKVKKQKAKEGAVIAEQKKLLTDIYLYAPNIDSRVARDMALRGRSTVDRFIDVVKADKKQAAKTGKAGNIGSYALKDGTQIKFDQTIYMQPETPQDVAAQARTMLAPASARPEMVQDTSFGQAVAQFFGAPRSRSELRQLAQQRAFNLAGYGSDLDMGDLDARALYYSAGGTPELQQPTGSLQLEAQEPLPVQPVAQAAEAFEGLKNDIIRDVERPERESADGTIIRKFPNGAAFLNVLDRLADPKGLVIQGTRVLQGSLAQDIKQDLFQLVGQNKQDEFLNKYLDPDNGLLRGLIPESTKDALSQQGKEVAATDHPFFPIFKNMINRFSVPLSIRKRADAEIAGFAGSR
tara:strand:+ start:1052 stop:2260 length:1209 start_codon:yes stop_codon:yes gene_type:complete